MLNSRCYSMLTGAFVKTVIAKVAFISHVSWSEEVAYEILSSQYIHAQFSLFQSPDELCEPDII